VLSKKCIRQELLLNSKVMLGLQLLSVQRAAVFARKRTNTGQELLLSSNVMLGLQLLPVQWATVFAKKRTNTGQGQRFRQILTLLRLVATHFSKNTLLLDRVMFARDHLA
jgi:hypothetical protein